MLPVVHAIEIRHLARSADLSRQCGSAVNLGRTSERVGVQCSMLRRAREKPSADQSVAKLAQRVEALARLVAVREYATALA